MDKDVLVGGSLPGPGDRRLDVLQIGDQRPLADVDARLPAAVDEDRYVVVVVAAPAAGGLERSSACDDGTGGGLCARQVVPARRAGFVWPRAPRSMG